ncbi:response regulator [Microvirga splendida]|uniref:Response regulator transcription factor n=1 Tax=Microvirga splendida TaxID=2795727 RepID=A0ABS0Y6J0_9HYPH|nr:response regulator transcription factor [Microvirga splendida]MBJ6127907.1 response regulator transcription factor [Microvirga splendida]
MGERIRVVVVDDHALFRTGVVQSLAFDNAIEVVGEGETAAEAVQLARDLAPDLILLDVSMPGNGIEAAREILHMPEPPRVAMLTVSESDDDVMHALEVGAVGYLPKGIRMPELIAAVRSLTEGRNVVSPDLALRALTNRVRAEASPLTFLSDQEKRTLRLVASGLSNREVGERLDVQEKTVKYHVTNILRKLKARNRVEAALIAKREWNDLGDKVM